MITMRAKMEVTNVKVSLEADEVTFRAVCKSEAYPEDGSDENNSFAKFSPSADLTMAIANPALHGKLRPGQQYYVDFTPASAPLTA